MICKNILYLRKQAGYSQEALAEKLGVTRQTLAKWESGESAPDVLHCDRLAEIFQVNIDDLIRQDLSENAAAPRDKFIYGTVTVGDKGQIVIPVKARRAFGIQPGDNLLVLGDLNQGLALVRADFFLDVMGQIREDRP